MLREIAEKKRLLICVIHLPPLPGSARYGGDFESVIDFAVKCAKNAEKGGADGVIVENFNDNPFLKKPDLITIIAMSVIVREIVKNVSIHVGVNILRNACREAVYVASLCGASFIRCNAYCQPITCPEGIVEPEAAHVWRAMKESGKRVEVLADINVKHASPLYYPHIEDLVRDCVERCLADFLIITGSRTGQPPDPGEVCNICKIADVPVLVGSGVNPSNIGLYKCARGIIVGTYVKDERGMIDTGRVERIRRELDML
ncbi:MAG: BtpA/SgcQ family protein [Crenarchaeota archaeon]|nr:BtpA/SgcQ family protein [Thermoproteota archaeon]